MSTLRKPNASSVSNQAEALTILVAFYDAIVALQNAVPATTSIINLGALTKDPGLPPLGKVFEYTIAGSLKVRTRTGIYVVAP